MANMKIVNLWRAVAHLSALMGKNEITSGEKDTIRKSKETTVITTANGKAESTDEATVHVHDLDVFATQRCCWNSHQQCHVWVSCAKKWDALADGNRRVSIIDWEK